MHTLSLTWQPAGGWVGLEGGGGLRWGERLLAGSSSFFPAKFWWKRGTIIIHTQYNYHHHVHWHTCGDACAQTALTVSQEQLLVLLGQPRHMSQNTHSLTHSRVYLCLYTYLPNPKHTCTSKSQTQMQPRHKTTLTICKSETALRSCFRLLFHLALAYCHLTGYKKHFHVNYARHIENSRKNWHRNKV